ncbi:MAG: indolepyruvate oxidoreductase subunit beta [Planctomycetota bacterium]
MKNEVTSIIICGVGGQGILLTSTILAKAALYSGFDVKKSEVHGMAQRGGSVISQIRFGKRVYSPLVPSASAKIIISLEKMEVLRYLFYLDPNNGIVIVNDYKIPPASVLLGKEKYPENIEKLLKDKVKQVYIVNANTIAEKTGSFRMANVVMLAIASRFMEIPLEKFKYALKECVPPKFYESNLVAFEAGIQYHSSLFS